jgi:hypothetical protein
MKFTIERETQTKLPRLNYHKQTEPINIQYIPETHYY